MSKKPAQARVVVDVQACTRLARDDCDNVVAMVGFTRVSELGDVAVTRRSVLSENMLEPSAKLDDLPRFVQQRGQCELVHKQIPCQPVVHAAAGPVNDDNLDVF